MDELALLEQDEREATALLREAQSRKRQLLHEQQLALQEQEELARMAYVSKLKRVDELAVLGITHSKLMQIPVPQLGAITVHADVLKLLRAALVHRSDAEFYQLVTALAIKLNEGRKHLATLVDQLRNDEATSSYFDASQDAVSIVIASGSGTALLSDLITCYALEYGRITQYES
jgi:hypothetical protein